MSSSKGRRTQHRPRRLVLPEEPSSTSHFQPDVTYGDYNDTTNFEPGSLAALSPSARGHTMKECEEQLSQLHKENFNLKLRIYFLEERLGHRGPPEPGTDAASWEATLRAEMESLRVELSEKQQLLCQAASAIDLVERKHKEEVETLGAVARAEKTTLEEQLVQLKQASQEQCKELEEKLSRMTAQFRQQQEELASITAQCKQHHCEVASVATQSVETSSVVEECEERIEQLVQELQLKGQQVMDAEQRVKELEEALCEKQPEIQIKVQELRERDSIIEEKQNQIEQQNKVLVEIQITLAEKQRLIDALNSTIAARDTKVAQLESQLLEAQSKINAIESRLEEEGHELSRVKSENEMLKTQLKRMNRTKEERESPRRKGNMHSRDSVSPRKKSLIEEAIEGIWSSPVSRNKEEITPLKEKENQWKQNEAKERTDRPQQLVDGENKFEKHSDRFNEENFLKLEREHQRGCEAIQGFITRVKHLTNENDCLRREWKKSEKKLTELRLELKELRDVYNKAKWEARQLQAEAMGVPGSSSTLADVKDMTEEENERLWAEVEDKNRKLAQVSLEMEKQVQDLLTSLKDKEALLRDLESKLETSERDVNVKKQCILNLEEMLRQFQSQVYSVPNLKSLYSIADKSQTREELPNTILHDLEAALKTSMLNLHSIFAKISWNKENIDDLQESLNIIFKKREMEISSLKHQVKFRDLQLKLFAEKMTEIGVNIPIPSMNKDCIPASFSQNVWGSERMIKDVRRDDDHHLSDVTCRGVLLTLEQQLLCSRDEQSKLRCEVESLRKQVNNSSEQGSDAHSVSLSALMEECNRLREDIYAAEVWKKNATNACNLLVGRLEELAGFLVSLLRHPERLGNLETNHCQFIKQAVQRSINLSRQLSMTIAHQEETDCSVQSSNSVMLEAEPNVNLSLVGQYLEEFNETKNKLNEFPFASCSANTIEKFCGITSNEAECSQDINSTLECQQPIIYSPEEQIEIILRLRAQVDTLKLEIKQRDIELNCLMQEHHLIKLSSPLFDLKNDSYDNPLASVTYYNKQHTACKPDHLDALSESKAIERKELSVNPEVYNDNDGSETSTDHVILPEPMCVNSNDVVHYQPASNNKHGRSGNTAARAQQDAVTLSESETWSEPDRQISLARIGLPEESTCLGLPTSTSFRHHHSRNLQELDESSASSQETTREISRTSGKRRSDAMEMRRLHARLRGLEQVNEALRTELAILHQIAPVASLSPSAGSPTVLDVREKTNSDESLSSKVVQTNNTPPPSMQQVENPVVIPSHLLEQIKHQREKLESSLFHNDFIRQQLEEVFVSATGHSSCNKLDGRKALLKIDGATDNLQGTQNMVGVIQDKLKTAEGKVKELETKLQEAEQLLLESKDQATKAAEAQKDCSVAQETLLVLHDKVKNLESQLQGKDDEINVKKNLVVELEEKVLIQNMDIKRMLQEMSDLKLECEKKESEAEEKVKELNKKLLNEVEEIEKDVILAEGKRKTIEQELKEAKENLKEAMLQKIEANKIIDMMKIEFTSKMHLCEEAQRNLELVIEQRNIESNKEMDRRSKKLELAEKQLEELRWVYKAEVEKKVKDAERLGNDIEAGLRKQIELAEKRTKEVEEMSRARESDLRKQVQESEKRFLDQVVVLRQKQDEAMLAASKAALERTKLVNEKLCLEQEVRRLEARELELRQEYQEAERRKLSMQEQLNDQILTLQHQKSELEQRVLDLEAANEDLRFHLEKLSHSKDGSHLSTPSSRRTTSPPVHGHPHSRPEPSVFPRESSYFSGRTWGSEGHNRSPDSTRSPLSSLVLQRGFGRQHSDFSDYMSEDQEYETIVTQSCSSYWITTVTGSRSDACNTPTGAEAPLGRNINSPDLGIESDQGRFSSLEANAGPITSDHGVAERCSAPELRHSSSAVQKFRSGRSDHNCKEIEERNIELKQELRQTRRALEETLAQLTVSNQRKQRVEKAICKQLQKTHSILMKTRGNLQPEHLMLHDDQI